MNTHEQNENEAGSEANDFVTVLSGYGLAPDVTDKQQKTMFASQERFLVEYRKFGTKSACARRARVHRSMLYDWENVDALGFRRRMRDAHEEYVNSQEELLQEIGEEKKHPVAIIARLNKESEEWNRPQTLIIDERPQRVLDALQEGRAPDVVEGRWKLAPGDEESRE